MKCNKCGTPIISGETRCRFCGKTVVIKKPEVINEPEKTIKKPEVIKEAELIIDAPKKEVKPITKTKTEIIDMPKKVSVESEKKVVASKPKSSEMIIDTPKAKKEPEVIMDTPKAKKEPEVIMDVPKAKKEPEVIIETPKKELKPIIKTNNEIIDIPKKENNVKVVKEEKKVQRKEIDVVDELEKTAKLERINLEEFTGKIDKEEIHNLIIEEKKKEEKNEEKEIKKDTKLIVEKAFHEKANNFMVLGILVCVLALSLTFNGYLYINRNKLSKNISKGVSKNTKIVYHDNYEFNIPDNWNTKGIASNNNMLIFDDTNEWGATIEILKNSVFEQTEQYKDDINNSFLQKGYTFTSSYNKETDEMDFYIYKGKYNAYSVYLIVGKINDENAIVTDLKFKGEVDKEILDNVLDVVSNIDSNTLQDLYESDFDFNQVGNLVKEKIKIAEGVVQ